MNSKMGSAFWGRRGCELVEERLEEYVTGALPEGEERARIAAHLADCSKCRIQATAYERVTQAWPRYSTLPLPDRPGDWQTVRAQLVTAGPTTDHTRPRLPLFGGRFLVAALAAGAGVTAVFLPSPLPREGNIVTRVESPTPVTDATLASSTAQPVSHLTGYMATGKNGKTLIVAPAFIGLPTSDAVPLIVEVGNPDDAREATITVQPVGQDVNPRSYHYKVSLAAHGTSRFTLYPTMGPDAYDNRTSLIVTLDAPGRHQTMQMPFPANRKGNVQVTYVGKHIGALNPRYEPQSRTGNVWQNTSQMQRAYVLPENAPDRSVGYNSVDMLVLSADAVSLNPTQWEAIHRWVISGGTLVLADASLLTCATEANGRGPTVGQRFGPFATPNGDVPSVGRRLLPDVEARYCEIPSGETTAKSLRLGASMPLTAQAVSQEQPIVLTKFALYNRRLGTGNIVYSTLDPTVDALRGNYAYGRTWETLLNFGRGDHWTIGNMGRWTARFRMLWDTTAVATDSNNPFQLGLPPLTNILYCFLGYFVLVVPVTFVVLKHMRRMNAAWITGPVLAIVSAGSIFLLTARLYMMPLSHRTQGIIHVASGEKTGQFVGTTELFFPRAGHYDIDLHHVEKLDTRRDGNRNPRFFSQTERSGSDGMTAQFDVPNLAFRRLYHEGQYSLGGSITADIHRDKDGNLVGYVDNQTGHPLTDAVLAEKRYLHEKVAPYELKPILYSIGTLPPGRTAIRLSSSTAKTLPWRANYAPDSSYVAYNYHDPYKAPQNETNYRGHGLYYHEDVPIQLTLLAKTSAKELGPQAGQDFSGDDSVTILVGLTTQEGGN